MSTFSRRPCAALAPWVQLLWATDWQASPAVPHRERVLPTGAMHVVLRLAGAPLTLFAGADGDNSQSVGNMIVGGARSAYYVKQAGDNACSVGVQLQPGAASWLLGAPASELAEQHTPLDALWGPDAARVCEQLSAVRQRSQTTDRQAPADCSLRAQVDLWESILLSRLRQTNADEQQLQWLTHALAGIDMDLPLAAIVANCGVSHRTLITRFRTLVGLSPKVFARIRRFQRVIAASQRAAPRISLAHLALDAGYADQAHMSRDFLAFAGVSPSTYSRLAPTAPNHVRVR